MVNPSPVTTRSNVGAGRFSIVRFKGDKEKADTVYNGYKPLTPDDVANVTHYTTTLPKHVNINDLVLMPTSQASSTVFHKED